MEFDGNTLKAKTRKGSEMEFDKFKLLTLTEAVDAGYGMVAGVHLEPFEVMVKSKI